MSKNSLHILYSLKPGFITLKGGAMICRLQNQPNVTLMLSLMVGCFFMVFVTSAEGKNQGELTVVEDVDLTRYLGLWYEIAKIPVWFQKGCAGGTSAEYSLLKEGVVSVVNRCCTEEGKLKEAKGRAWVVDKKTPAKLKVSFVSLIGFWLFGGKYWIIDLDPDYKYTVIGHPNRELGWILSRTPSLSEDVLQGIAERLKDKGYDFAQFEMTNQTGVTCFSETPSK
jgi:apolipoprotein D and lipocalin family protein